MLGCKNLFNIDKITHLHPGGSFDYAMKKLKNKRTDKIIKTLSMSNIRF